MPQFAIPEPKQEHQVLLKVKGANSRGIYLVGNNLHDASTAFQPDTDVKEGTVKAAGNF